ncbi:isovaleryl-CoA dehydrogenase [Cupriavidus sp. TKC]|uniref:acyl-CoA dehydrogenase family protein n=1 Tax=Cupriavidus sp. TKC TaxID=2880159 RepID=UPI0025A92B4C|nr:acyl-CoA dehydrogenase family protein [Cupriavidus sp. TKC]GMG94207.1 isovaleryl-CoA dehydrogenase [Cupriavidus sp. TKC]
MMDEHDSEELLSSLRETVRRFAQAEIAPLARRIDQEDWFARALWPKLGELGVLGPTVSEEYGGAGLGYLAHAVISEEISRVSGSVGISYIAHSNLCVNQIHLHGTDEQKRRFLPDLLSGEAVGALAMSEAGAGSDVVSMTCRARLDGDVYRLNGTKLWTTNGWHADTYVVYAKTEPGAGKAGITAFIVRRDSPGFEVRQRMDKLGMRGSGTCELVFEDTPVPVEQVLGTVNHGVRVLMRGLDYERLVASSACVGFMQAALDMVLPYVSQRRQFGQVIGEFQLIQAKLADMYTRLNASRSYLHAMAGRADRGESLRKESASVILLAAESATQSALDAIQCLGGNGYVNDYDAGRLLRDAKLYEIGAGTSEIRRVLIGRELMREANG